MPKDNTQRKLDQIHIWSRRCGTRARKLKTSKAEKYRLWQSALEAAHNMALLEGEYPLLELVHASFPLQEGVKTIVK